MDWFNPPRLPKKWFRARVALPLAKWDREHYLPFRPNELLKLLRSTRILDPSQHDRFVELCRSLKLAIRVQYQGHHEYLIDLYSQFDPDRDIDDRVFEADTVENNHHVDPELGAETAAMDAALSTAPKSEERPKVDEHRCRELFSEIADSLHHANYRRLSPREIQAAIGAATHWGVRLRIRFSSFRRLEVYGRGDIVTRRERREWKALFRRKEFDVPVYQRLVVIFRPRELQALPDPLDPNRVHIRMFKNIPKADIDMMLPGSQVRLSWLDTGKIGIPTLWGIVMMTSKIAKTLSIVAILGALKVVSWFLLLIAVTAATIFYGVKSLLSYTTTKRRYQLNITRSLYYQNLDNNLGALLRLEEEAEQQEICECMIAYFVMLAANQPLSERQIDDEAERLLERLAGYPIDFDVADALRDLGGIKAISFSENGWSTDPAVS